MAEEILRIQITGPHHSEIEYEVEVMNTIGHNEKNRVTFMCLDKKTAVQLHNALLFNTSSFTID